VRERVPTLVDPHLFRRDYLVAILAEALGKQRVIQVVLLMNLLVAAKVPNDCRALSVNLDVIAFYLY
jgi:hypothetical protein